ncbi:DUF4340 domain-containing protein [Methylocaldum szegediense]|uniref:DUF4340 domain-containing protein n=1 Tax=Methylocaldum szegediense TaxID=73780 RepID=UPI0004099DDF|nr:DUF4340 domain-containing protein [Methylocaldum szegediense]
MNRVNTNSLLVLAALAVVAVIAAIIVTSNREPASESPPGPSVALPELRDRINDVTGVTVIAAEKKPVVTLVRGDQGWTIKEEGDYPANTGKLRELLLKIAGASLLEPKTENAERYPELGVEDVERQDASGVLLSFDGLGKPVQLIVGKISRQADGTFVRRPGDKQSWLAKGALQVEREPEQWLDKALADIPSDRIAEVVLTRPSGKPLRLYKTAPDDKDYKVADIPSGRELKDASAVSALASTLSGLNLVDALPDGSSSPPAQDQIVKARYRTFDGLTVDVQAWKQDDKRLARFSAMLDNAVADAHIQAEQAKAKADYEAKNKEAAKSTEENTEQSANTPDPAPLAVTDPAKDREQRLEALNREVETLNRRFARWSFVIPEYKYANMDKSLDDVLNPVADKKDGPKEKQTKKSGKR